MIRVGLPFHLQTLAGTGNEVQLEVSPPVTIHAVLDVLESTYPMLRGTIRDHVTLQRRPLIRFITCGRDMSQEPQDTCLPDEVCDGTEPFMVIGAIAGG